jgi:hypothetical protein
MKKILAHLLIIIMAASCAPRWIPNKSVQAKLIGYTRHKHYLTTLYLQTTDSTMYAVTEQRSGKVHYNRYIGDWYTLQYDSTAAKCDSVTRISVKRNN